ncbi:MAG: glycosyltransferase family 4 protein [Planctomycetota bacterium]|jgi:glycosyltransferase involved in cell wall biosynthesis
MRILYLHQYFVTRSEVGGTRSYEFARYLQRQGHQVTVVTATSGNLDEERKTHRLEIDGIEVIELKAGYGNSMQGTKISYRQRIYKFLAFALSSTNAGLTLRKPDVVFATSTPLTIGIPGLIISKLRRVPLVFEVRDLWPEAPIQLGALKSPSLIKVARWLERTIYSHSAHIIALSPGMRDGIVATGVPGSKVTVIPNSSDLDLFSPSVDGSDYRRKLALNGQFTCVYFGAMGEANGLDFVLDVASELKEREVNDVVFVLHGDGKERQALESRCVTEELSNVIFSNPVPDKGAIAQLASAASVCMTIYKNLPVLYTCSPNKMFDSLAAGKPVLVNMPGWLRELVEQNNAGVFVKPDNPTDFADKVIFLRDNPELCTKYGQNARRLAEEQFARHKLAGQLEKIFINTLQ